MIAEGWHQYGELHAERDALQALSEPAEGATIYVTLEPCRHYGKQPPCTLAIIEHGISRVVIGSRDPNPLVAGKGVRMLREHGITVEEDFMREECDALNPSFPLHHHGQAVCEDEVRDDCGRQNSDKDRRLEMDYVRRDQGIWCTTGGMPAGASWRASGQSSPMILF